MHTETRLRAANRDRLWVPLLTHYAASGMIDAPRMLAHLRSIRPWVGQIMLAGSTGDGWELGDDAFEALIDLAASPEMQAQGPDFLFGVLRPTTAEVVARLELLERRLAADANLAASFRGAVVCPPVDPGASQDDIIDHFRRVLASSRSPIAVYQLPQVTGGVIAAETLARLVAEHPRIVMFKDSSGEDLVAKSGQSFDGTVLVRGAEGDYLEALTPSGPYHGWLLSTGNALGQPLRRLLSLKDENLAEEARSLSAEISNVVAAVFAAAQDEGGANAFSNANRAMDHLLAHGSNWHRVALPRKVNGDALSYALVEAVEEKAGGVLGLAQVGYLSDAG
ncbi:dihydrodipicolinate synthase family protein [Aurantimonas sp. HBX-1]|uniref:dihydrodipicolinate synthase family protein n=1 Tax=Aurantimonas sp. HBX-1 TaxID=2906072 RepID=UPI001F1BF3AD|nr:dihydrodipicolinate synthase family protein [Aurantimonas sp. HBX-1]UIJ73443.1 dihydrodipicolinate synthase family protein [Aurantimonas sp. HBX-1]